MNREELSKKLNEHRKVSYYAISKKTGLTYQTVKAVFSGKNTTIANIYLVMEEINVTFKDLYN